MPADADKHYLRRQPLVGNGTYKQKALQVQSLLLEHCLLRAKEKKKKLFTNAWSHSFVNSFEILTSDDVAVFWSVPMPIEGGTV